MERVLDTAGRRLEVGDSAQREAYARARLAAKMEADAARGAATAGARAALGAARRAANQAASARRRRLLAALESLQGQTGAVEGGPGSG